MVYLLRTYVERFPQHRFWVAFNAEGHRVTGKLRETRFSVLWRWKERHGMYRKVIRYRGIMRPSEAAATIASVIFNDHEA